MAITQNTFNGDGSNLGPFSFTFKWLEPTDIKVTVSGVLKTAGTHYNLQSLNYATKSGGQVLFTAGNAPAVGTGNIVVYRQTDDSDLSATFNSGSAIRAQDLVMITLFKVCVCNSTIPTTAAVNNRLIDLINDVGAYVVVSSELTFPDAGIVDAAGNPDAGVLVAVTDATGLAWSSGTSTNARTNNNTVVTITGITGTSPISNCGVQVLSTSTLHTYTFVRWVVGSSVAQTISDNINEILLVDSNAAAAAASEAAAASSASAAATSASNAASSASAASTSASNAASSASAASTSATNAATSAASAANSVTALNNLGYYLNWGLITDAVGTTSDYGALV
jgi:hypothetical protein